MDSKDESETGRPSNRKILASRSGSGSECLLFGTNPDTFQIQIQKNRREVG